MDSKRITYASIEDYIETFPPEIQLLLQAVRETIRSAAPEAKEKISYQMPTFDLHGNLVHFAAFKQHIGFYPGADGIAAFKDELSAYKGAKGSVQFPLDKPLPHELIGRIVVYRAAQNKSRADMKPGKRKTDA
ncbi:iron chaperone [Cohnella sp. JJ-181]|uniref:iron chaperone n=1 Tax=Cohnella rhizoplanae TaxID=2974897 RepID=UPI0022FF661A|nr:DUF1801 domain-containing protein [Cohnella sp. JJ-181]CAI6080760.1 hypothetical protein COHCIP112018_03091 [Cohnella sp. JJ-181]